MKNASPLRPAALRVIGQLKPYAQALVVMLAVSMLPGRCPPLASLLTARQLKEYRNRQRRDRRAARRRHDVTTKGGAR
jgi:hypothetical protein